MYRTGISSKINFIDEGFINAAFTCAKNIISNIEDPEQYPLWNMEEIKHKYDYEDGDFETLFNDSLDIFTEMKEGQRNVEKFELSEYEFDMFIMLHDMLKDISGILNANEQNEFFYQHIMSRATSRQAFIASFVELITILDALKEIIEVVDEDGNPIDNFADKSIQVE